jgi:8-oxo-dGTP pyrophosphatase MutT (NUDIX family)
MPKTIDFYQVSLKVLLKNNQGEILVLKNPNNDCFAGYYDLPGGRIDTDEFNTDFAAIIAREIAEETGEVKFSLQPAPVALGRHAIPTDPTREEENKHVLYIFFEAEYLDGDIQISNEHLGYKWVNLQEINLLEYFTSGILEGVRKYLER